MGDQDARSGRLRVASVIASTASRSTTSPQSSQRTTPAVRLEREFS